MFEPWLYRLTANAAYDYLRKRKRSANVRMADLTEEQISLADAAAGAVQSGKAAEKKEIRKTVDLLLSRVSEEDRILLSLKEIEGLSLKELGRIYRVNETP